MHTLHTKTVQAGIAVVVEKYGVKLDILDHILTRRPCSLCDTGDAMVTSSSVSKLWSFGDANFAACPEEVDLRGAAFAALRPSVRYPPVTTLNILRPRIPGAHNIMNSRLRTTWNCPPLTFQHFHTTPYPVLTKRTWDKSHCFCNSFSPSL